MLTVINRRAIPLYTVKNPARAGMETKQLLKKFPHFVFLKERSPRRGRELVTYRPGLWLRQFCLEAIRHRLAVPASRLGRQSRETFELTLLPRH